jgi:hypothetical protein
MHGILHTNTLSPRMCISYRSYIFPDCSFGFFLAFVLFNVAHVGGQGLVRAMW